MVDHPDEAKRGPEGQPRSAQSEAPQRAERRLALARSNVEPIGNFLHQVIAVIADRYEQSARLEQIGEMRATAQNTYEVRYSFRHVDDDARLALTFILTGEQLDLILLQGHERSAPRNLAANPGQVDQHAYRLDELEELKRAIREKIVTHLTARDPTRIIDLGD